MKVIEEIIELSLDEHFMALNNYDIFPNAMMLDGNDVIISVKTDSGNLTLESNMLDESLSNGIIEMGGGEIPTPFHQLAEIAFGKLGTRDEGFEEDDNTL